MHGHCGYLLEVHAMRNVAQFHRRIKPRNLTVFSRVK